MPETSNTSTATSLNISKLRFSLGFAPKLVFVLKFIFIIIITSFIASFLSGIFTAINIDLLDSNNSLAYMALTYFMGNYYHLDQKQNLVYFISGLLLSFFVSFTPGSIFLLLVVPFLKASRLITSTT